MYIFENTNAKCYRQSSCISSLWFQLIITVLVTSTLLAYWTSSHTETHGGLPCPKAFAFTAPSAQRFFPTLSHPPHTCLTPFNQLANLYLFFSSDFKGTPGGPQKTLRMGYCQLYALPTQGSAHL